MTEVRRHPATAFALLLSVILALSSWMGTGLAAKSELANIGPAKLVRADFHSQGCPQPEAGDAEIEDNEDSDDRSELLLSRVDETPSLQPISSRPYVPVEVRSLASVRVREGHGARGPPLA